LRPVIKYDCQHRGTWSGQLAFVTYVGATETMRGFAIHACAVHGECLPTFKCTKEAREATSERWTRSDGGESVPPTCRGCEQFSAANSPDSD
jgi:hypothetical protein